MRSFLLFALFAGSAFIACSSSSSDAPTGGSCSTSASCGTGICLHSNDFPNGYCSQGCDLANASSCPSGSVCIDDASGAPPDAGVTAVCYQSCTQTSDCQTGLACLEKSSKKVCRAG